MPKDKAGKFHLNSQKAAASDKMATKAEPKALPLEQSPAAPTSQDSAISGSPADHLTAMHAESGGTHMHVHDDGMGMITSHHIGEGGQVEGPHEHPDHEALKEHMGRVFGGGEHAAPMQEGGAMTHGMRGL